MKPFCFLFLSLSICCHAGSLLDEYRSPKNPYYWKNKPALLQQGYWQQDVAYHIDARLDETSDILSGTELIEYANNSPDTLYFVYFRLTQNAFQPGAYLDKLYKENKEKVVYGKYEQQKLGTEILQIQHQGREAKTEAENTILKVYLNEPLYPGTVTSFSLRFNTYFDEKGSGRRRMKMFTQYKQKHYDGVHWYPRLSVYDRKFGWTTDQHLGREFYGDFGIFELSLDMSNDAVLEATGKLLNREEVLPDELRQKLDITRFAKTPWGSAPSVVIPYEKDKRKIWRFKALNVHDVAFTSDPAYRIGEARFGEVQVVALAQEGHCSGWQNAASYTAEILKVYSRDFGNYAYNKMVVADARDGMEYPMITLDGGRDPDYRSLLAHEVGHNWFFGMVGNNETYRAMLDEGFTQFLTAWAIEHIDGSSAVSSGNKNTYKNRHRKTVSIREQRCYNTYLQSAIRREPTSINTHSDGFNGATGHGGGYRLVYYKTATMLWNLQYVLGDSLFQAAMKNYFRTYCIAHPYVEDFRNSIIRFTHCDLNWFFDQWIETYKTLDYSVSRPRLLQKNDSGYVYDIAFKRTGDMQMPIDFACETHTGKKFGYHIPNDWFVKKTSATVLPRWLGWDKLQPEYHARVLVPEKIRKVSIDTSSRLADCKRTNNAWPRNIIIEKDYLITQPVSFMQYSILHRPDLFFNSTDGVKAGWHAEGSYAGLLNRFSVSAWLNTRILANPKFGPTSEWISYTAQYHTPLNRERTREISLESRRLDGLFLHQLSLQGKVEESPWRFKILLKSFRRFNNTYLYYPEGWQTKNHNRSVNLELQRALSGRGWDVSARFTLRSGIQNLYAYAEQEIIAKVALGKSVWRSRSYARFGSRNIPMESSAWLSGANPEALMDLPVMRAAGWFPNSWMIPSSLPGHVQAAGGYHLRGYAGYLFPTGLFNENGQVYRMASDRGVSYNTEYSWSGWLPSSWVNNSFYTLDSYLFFDGAIFNTGTFHAIKELPEAVSSSTEARADAGAGICMTWKKWGNFEKISPLTIRVDFPFYLSHRPYAGISNLSGNWVLGIQKSF